MFRDRSREVGGIFTDIVPHKGGDTGLALQTAAETRTKLTQPWTGTETQLREGLAVLPPEDSKRLTVCNLMTAL